MDQRRIGHLLFGLLFAATAVQSALGQSPAPDVDTIVNRWARTSQQFESFDAQLTCWNSDGIQHTVEVGHGRFYFESPDQGRLELHHSGTIIWLGDVVKIEEANHGRFYFLRPSAAEREKLLDKLSDQPKGFVDKLGKGISRFCVLWTSPETYLPFVVRLNADQLRQRFEITRLC